MKQHLEYWLDFIVVPVIIAACAYLATSISFAIAGYVAWVFFEYFLHRVAFHDRRSPFFRPHMVHHNRPMDEDGQPMPGLAIGILVLHALLTDASWALGFTFGYLTYITTHHLIHVGYLTGPIAQRHEMHHKGWHLNFNLLCPLGDLVFGTYRSSK